MKRTARRRKRAGDTRRRRPAPKEVIWAYLNLAVLWTFAVAQPLFDLLRDNPEFLAARGSTGFDIISFSVLLVVLPPAALLAIELLAGLAGEAPRRWVHVVLIGVLVALIAAQALKKSLDASDAVLIALSDAIGAGVALLYARVDSEQRVLEMPFTVSGTTLTVTAPDHEHPHGAPRGWYMVFILNEAGVPSEARFMLLH